MADQMRGKKQILEALRDIFNRWDRLLPGVSEEEATRPQPASELSLKDEVAHLWAWQQRTVARAEAALGDSEPNYPAWPEALGPDLEEDVDRTNAWIYETYKDKPWPAVYADWKSQFQRLLQLSEQTSEEDLLGPDRYTWMGGYPLSDSLEGTWEHHQEHFDDLLARSGRTQI